MSRPLKAAHKPVKRDPVQALFDSVTVVSLANGELRVTPKWRNVREYTEADGGGPGIMRRMAGASRLQRFINAHLRKTNKQSASTSNGASTK